MPNLLERLTSPPKPTLYTQAPTPYNIHYTLSTRSLPSTFARKIMRYLGAVVRILVGAAAIVILVVWVRWVLDWGDGVGSWIGPELLDGGEGSWLGLVNEKAVVGGVKEWWTLPIALAVLWVVVRRGYSGTYILTHIHHLHSQLAYTSIHRRVPHHPPLPRPASLHHKQHIPTNPHAALHSQHEHTRHCHTRGV